MRRETTTGDIDIFLRRYAQQGKMRANGVSCDIYFYRVQLFSKRKIPRGRVFWKDWSRTEGKAKFVFYRSIISVRVGVRYSLGMDELRRVLPIAHRLACMERRTESLEARTNIEKHRGSTKGAAGISKRGSEHQLPGRIPDDRILRDSPTSSRRGEIVSFSLLCREAGSELIEPDINPPFVYPRSTSLLIPVFDIYQESR